MSDAVPGVGTSFKRGDGESDEDFTAISEIMTIGGPNKTRETIDVTNLDSSGGYREFIPSFRDGGEVTLNMNWTRDGYDLLNDDFETQSSVNYQIVFPDTGATTFEFAAYVTGVEMNTPTDAQITMDVTLKITGQITMSS